MTQARDSIIEVAGLSKVFKDFWGRPKVQALSEVDLHVKRGEVFALLGPNGSGKSTLIKILMGFLFPSSGGVSVFGKIPTDIKNKYRIGFLPERPSFHDHLSGIETLTFHSRLLGISKKKRQERIETLLKLTRMKEHAHRRTQEYSLGMLRRLGLAQALLSDPELLILDEPTNGLDPIGMDEVKDIILELKEKGKTILICTHLLSEIEELCDRAAILFNGRVLSQGPLQELLSSDPEHTQWKFEASLKDMQQLKAKGDELGLKFTFDSSKKSLKDYFLELVHKKNAEAMPEKDFKSDESSENEGSHYLDQLTAKKP